MKLQASCVSVTPQYGPEGKIKEGVMLLIGPSVEHGISGGAISLNLIDPKSFGKFSQNETCDIEVSSHWQTEEKQAEEVEEEPTVEQAEELDQESKDFRATLKAIDAR